MNNKAQFNIFTYMVTVFIAVIFFGSLIWMMGLINDIFTDVGIQNDEQNANSEIYVNMTQASQDIFGELNDSIQALRMVSIVYILGLGMCIIITNALQSKHPLWFFIYVLISVLAIMFAVPISNAYEEILSTNMMDGTLSTMGASNFIVLNLPTLVLVITLLGGIFLFINLVRPTGGDVQL